MIICPYCDAENIEGADFCEQCANSLSDMHRPIPASAVERALLVDRVTSLISRPPVTAAPSTPVRQILQLLHESAVGCVVLVEGGRPVGIFSERDVLLKIGSRAAAAGDDPVVKFMTPNPQTLPLDATIAFAVHRMDLGGFRHIPIVSAENELLGVISVRDILRHLTETLAE
jgi:CBS domain-containing protein